MNYKSMDLNQILIKNPAATFYGRDKGTSMIDAAWMTGIYWLSISPWNAGMTPWLSVFFK